MLRCPRRQKFNPRRRGLEASYLIRPSSLFIADLMFQGEFAEVVGPENICDNVQEALSRAEEVYEGLEAKFVTAKS